MYLHIGLNYLIKTKYIVGIFDMENTTTSSITKRFLADAEKFGEVVSATQEIPKSFVVYKEKKKTTVYLSQFSTATLQKRSVTGKIDWK